MPGPADKSEAEPRGDMMSMEHQDQASMDWVYVNFRTLGRHGGEK